MQLDWANSSYLCTQIIIKELQCRQLLIHAFRVVSLLFLHNLPSCFDYSLHFKLYFTEGFIKFLEARQQLFWSLFHFARIYCQTTLRTAHMSKSFSVYCIWTLTFASQKTADIAKCFLVQAEVTLPHKAPKPKFHGFPTPAASSYAPFHHILEDPLTHRNGFQKTYNRL